MNIMFGDLKAIRMANPDTDIRIIMLIVAINFRCFPGQKKNYLNSMALRTHIT